MASLVNPSNINGNFPIAGQDNDSQGFRDNFTNIRNNFTFIKTEVEDLQSKAVLKSALTGLSLDNNFLGSQIKNVQLKNYSETLYDWGITSGDIVLDLALGNVHKIYTSDTISINSVIKNWPTSLQWSRVLVYVTVSSLTHKMQLPSSIVTDLSAIPGLRNKSGSYEITFGETGNYIFEFSSTDSGQTVFVRELTKGNPVFRDPNFYFTNIGAGLSGTGHETGYETPSLKLGWGNIFSVSDTIDGIKSGLDTLSIRGAVTSYLSSEDGDNNSANLKSAGYTVSRSRVTDPTAGVAVTLGDTERVANGDLIGYYNAMGFAGAGVGISAFQQLGSVQFYANGTNTTAGLGGNVVIATKRDGIAGLQPAMVIDSSQGVTIFGNLDVKGATAIIESSVLNIVDKQIVVAKGATTGTLANGGGISIDNVNANIEYFHTDPVGTLGGGQRLVINKALTVSLASDSNSSTTGSMVVAGGLGIGGNLNVGGSMGLTSVAESTAPTVGSFVVSGGLGVAKNINAAGMIASNSTAVATGVGSGALQSAGGFSVAGAAFFGSNVLIANTTQASSTTDASTIILGGLGVVKNVIANGFTILGNVTNSIYSPGSSGAPNPYYNGALVVTGGAHIARALNVGDDSGLGNIRINVGVSNGDITYDDMNTGSLVIGNVQQARYGGATISGSLQIGINNSGSLYLRNRNNAFGAIIAGSPVAYTPLGGSFGAMTALGGVNIFGNINVGQPSDGTNPGFGSGNIYIQSGTPSISFNTGALVVQAVVAANGRVNSGGVGIAGNLWVQGNVYLGSLASADSNVVVVATTTSTSSTSGALVVKGGVGIAGNAVTAGNLVITSATAGSINTNGAGWQEGALVVSSGGMYINNTSVINGNLVLTASQASTTTTSGALVVAGTAGVGIGGRLNVGQFITVTDTTAGGAGTGALVLSGAGAGASIAGNLFVQGSAQPINAVGASGVALVSGVGSAQSVTSASLTDVTNLNFTAEANKSYFFEAWIFHDCTVASAAAMTKTFSMVFSAGTCNYTVEQNASATGAMSVASAVATASSAGALATASSTSVTGMLARIQGTYYHTAATNVKVQASISGGSSPTLSIKGQTFFKWTKLN
jgi:hypothetical protein